MRFGSEIVSAIHARVTPGSGTAAAIGSAGPPRRRWPAALLASGVLMISFARPSATSATRSPWAGTAAARQATQPVADINLPLTVTEPAGIERRADPVTAGVPLAAHHEVTDVSGLRLTAADGRTPVAAQFQVLARWNAPVASRSSPIKWLLVHFQADVDASGSTVYYLRSGAAGSARQQAAGMVTTPSDEAIEVDTGRLRFRISRRRFNLLDGVALPGGGQPGANSEWIVPPGHGGGVLILRSDGSSYRSSDDDRPRVTIEEDGPLRTVIRIDGRHQSDTANDVRLQEGRSPYPYLDSTLRIHAYRGKSWVRIFHSLRNPDRYLTSYHNGGGEPIYHEFDGFELLLPTEVRGNDLIYTAGGEASVGFEYPDKQGDPDVGGPPLSAPLDSGSTALFYQDSSGVPNWQDTPDGTWGTTFRGYRVWLDQQTVASGLQGAGWVDLRTAEWGVSAGIRHFWQNFPKAISVSGDGTLTIQLWPRRFSVPHYIGGGRQKTHELFLRFHRSDAGAAESFGAFAAPLHATAPNTWYQDTLALGLISIEQPRGDELFDRLEATADAVIQHASQANGGNLWRERLQGDLYGWRNWGDSYRGGWKGSRYFGNNEFDFCWTLLLQYLRKASHDRRFFDLGESMARHLADIDIYHTDQDAPAYSHGVRQHDASGITDHGRAPLMSHFWIEGLLTYYFLTGDRLALETALETARWLEALIDDRTGELGYHPQSRSQAWAALALVQLSDATGEAGYLDAAVNLLRAEIIEEQDLSTAVYPCSDLDWEGDKGQADKSDASIWQNGYVAEALGRFAFTRRLAGTPDSDAEGALFRLLDAIEQCGFATPDNDLFDAAEPSRDNVVYDRRYEALVLDRIYADGSYGIEYPNNHLLTNGYAYGALLTTDPDARQRYRQLARQSWIWTMGPESAPGVPNDVPVYCCPDTPAKNAAMMLRFGQPFLWLEQQLTKRERR